MILLVVTRIYTHEGGLYVFFYSIIKLFS